MARLLGILLVLSGLTLVAPPAAQAAVSVSISVTPTTLPYGQTTLIRGKALEAKPGSVVKLQRKVGTTWQTVAQTRVWATRAYGFSIKPPRGYQYYRVLKPRQLGQREAVSWTVRLTVNWRPSVRVTATNGFNPATGEHWTDTSGTTTALPPHTTVWVQTRNANGVWINEEIPRATTLADGTFSRRLVLPHGTVARYVVPGSGARLAGYSSAFTVSWAPYYTPLNSSVRVNGVAESTPQTVEFEAVAGQRIGIVATDSNGEGSASAVLRGPDGQTISYGEHYTGSRLVAPATGRYRLTYSSYHPVQLASFTLNLSLPKVIAGSLDTTTPLTADLPGQEVELAFQGEIGETVTQYAPPVLHDCTKFDLLDPSGVVLEPWRRLNAVAPVWRLEQHGSHRVRYTPCGTEPLDRHESLWRAVEATVGVDGDSTAVDFSDPGRVALLDLPVTAGQAFTLASSHALNPPTLRRAFFSPDGSIIESNNGWLRMESAQAGVYQVLLSVAPGVTGTTTWWASSPLSVGGLHLDGDATPYDLGPAVGREVSLEVNVPAGQLFTMVNDFPDGSHCGTNANIGWEGTAPFFQFVDPRVRPVYQRWSTPLPGQFRPCSEKSSLRLVSVEEPKILTIDGPAVELPVGQDGKPVLARVAVTRGDQVRFVIDSSGLPEGAPFSGAAGGLYPWAVDEQYHFTSTASTTPLTLWLNQIFIEPELVLNLTTRSGIEGTVSVRVVRN